VRPIMLLNGGREVNEIWFENVRVPVENRIGEEIGAGPMPSSCLATSAPTLPASASPSANSQGSSTLRGASGTTDGR